MSKRRLALYAGIAFAFCFAFTWSLPSGFNLIFLCAAGYSFFLYWYFSPRVARPVEERSFDFRTSSGQPQDAIRRIARLVGIVIASLFFLFLVIGIFSTGNESQGEGNVDVAVVDDEGADWLTTGNNFYAEQQYDSALYYFDRVIQRESSNAAAWHNKGLVYYDRQEMNQALD